MGYWANNILGGDQPLDYVTSIGTSLKFGNENTWLNKPEKTKLKLEGADELFLVKKITNKYGGKSEIDHDGALAVAFMHLRVGAKLPDLLKLYAIQACDNEDYTRWTEPKNRKLYIEAFRAALLNYDNQTPYEEPDFSKKSLKKRSKP